MTAIVTRTYEVMDLVSERVPSVVLSRLFEEQREYGFYRTNKDTYHHCSGATLVFNDESAGRTTLTLTGREDPVDDAASLLVLAFRYTNLKHFYKSEEER